MEINQYNGMTLAYIGDAIYELCIRQYVLNSNETKVKQLHKKVTKLVNSSAQAKFIHYLLNKNILTDEEKIFIYEEGMQKLILTAKMLI